MSTAADRTRFEFGNHTDIGQVRAANEDYMGYFNTVNGHVFVVCDGMGGHVGGATAAQIGVESVRKFFEYKAYENLPEALRQSILYANQQIIAHAQQNPQLRGMGTTIVLLVVKEGQVWYAHVGDSRIYLQSKGKLIRLTKDHSMVQGMVDQGLISEAEAESHPQKNQLSRALGAISTIEVDVSAAPINPAAGDIFMLCTDGLNGMLLDPIIQQTLEENLSAQHKAMKLISLANEAGGFDNITVQLIHFPLTVSGVPTVTEDMAKKKTAPVKSKSSSTNTSKSRTSPGKKGPDIALIVLCILAAIVLVLLVMGWEYMSDDVVQTTELVTAPMAATTDKEENRLVTKAEKTSNNAASVTKEEAPKPSTASIANKPASNASTSPSTSSPKPATGNGIITHTVKPGETFSAIARRYNVTNATLQSWNPAIKDTEKDIKANTTQLQVKVKALHKVGPGDVLDVVSKKYGVDKSLIMAANGKTADLATRGETLVIPFPEKK